MAKPAYTIAKLECDAFDTRVLRRHIQNNRVSPDDAEAHLKSLPDAAAEGEEITVTLGDDPAEASEGGEEAAEATEATENAEDT